MAERGRRSTPANADGVVCVSVRSRGPMHGKERTSGGARALESDGRSGGSPALLRCRNAAVECLQMREARTRWNACTQRLGSEVAD